ncbi:MAG: anhydro-N-acetylmuramic acid kinase [Candidatus Kapabacteria bacterium]|nr:anhydro-N-acetylmuramic acid kinase [Candidatus Kapabacteria bacterium]
MEPTGIWLSEPRNMIGIMTGTSVDGIDVCLAEFSFLENKQFFKLKHFRTFEFSSNTKEAIFHALNGRISAADLSRLNFILASEFTEIITIFLNLCNCSLISVDAVAVHGQTIWHEPSGEIIPNTLQAISGPALGAILDKPVIYDFRSADIALGGQGAPLVPIFDYEFLSSSVNRIALNIGGMSNITFLPSSKDKSQVLAFDTGPGNVLIDIASNLLFSKDYDDHGHFARKGEVLEIIFSALKSTEYCLRAIPKSTGRELFNMSFINDHFNQLNNFSPNDILATLTEFTAWSIFFNIKHYIPNSKELIISGGGCHNDFLVERLQFYLPEIIIIKSNELGINSDAKEALCFAYLGWLSLGGIPGNIPSVTGAKRHCVLGARTF